MPKEKIKDVELYYHLDEAKNNPQDADIIVFINGVGMTVRMWDPIATSVGENYRVLRHDTRGQLFSEKPEADYSMEMHAQDLRNLLEHLGINTKVHLVGTSYGAEIAAIFAYTWPELSKSLTMICGVSELDKVLYTAVESWADAADPQFPPEHLLKVMTPWNYSAEFIANNWDFVQGRLDNAKNLPKDFFPSFVRLVRSFQKLDITDQLENITCPTYIMAAEQDIIKPPKYSEMMHKAIPGSRYDIVKGSGHAIVVEKPTEVSRLLMDFIQSI